MKDRSKDFYCRTDIAKIIDDLLLDANEDQQCVLCEAYQRIIQLPNAYDKIMEEKVEN